MSKSEGPAPLTVEFTNLTSGADGYLWSFGDGTESTEREPSHTYTKAGSYTVTLRAVEEGEVQESNEAAKLVTVEAGPLNKLVLDETELTLMPQEEHAFSVKVMDAYDNPISNLSLTFRSMEQAGQIDDQGTFTAGTNSGDYQDAITVEATQGGVTKRAAVDVTIDPGPPDHVIVSPDAVTLAVGDQQQFEATAFDAFDNEIWDMQITWGAGAAGGIDARGLFTAGPQSGRFSEAIKATVVKDGHRAAGTASVGIRLTIGPYTWPPGKNGTRPTSFDPKHRLCWAALKGAPSPDFPNSYDTIRGPVDVAYLHDLRAAGHNLHHDDWTGCVETVTAGGTARITLYPEENFRGAPHTIEPGETFQIGDSQPDQVASLKIEHVPETGED